MINKIKQLSATILFFSISIVFVSCKDDIEDIVDIENPNSPSIDEVFNNLDDTESSLNAVYNTLYNHFILAIEQEALSSDIARDANQAPTGVRNSQNVQFTTQLFNSNSAVINNRWAALYRGIFFANQTIIALKGLESTLLSEAQVQRWTQQMAQARFFRGLYHFYLHERYNNGNIIIIGEEEFTQDINELNARPTSPSSEVIAFFREDLQFAHDNLLGVTDVENGVVTKGSAAMILANSYLYEKEYDLAKPLYEELISPDSGYALVEDTNLMFTTAGEFNSESILEVAYTIDFGTEIAPFNEEALHNRLGWASAFTGTGGAPRFAPAIWLIDEYSGEVLDGTDPRNTITRGDGVPDLRRVSLRASAMVALPQDLETPYYLNANALQTTISFRGTPFSVLQGNRSRAFPSMFKHFTNHDIVSNERLLSSGNQLQSGKNVTINRLAEAYLNLAEIYLLGDGNVNSALEMINTVRSRWGLQKLGPGSTVDNEFDNIAYTVESLFEHLRNKEKPLELSMEGYAIRNIDLRRWETKAQRFTELSNLNLNLVSSADLSEELVRGQQRRIPLSRVVVNGLMGGLDPKNVLTNTQGQPLAGDLNLSGGTSEIPNGSTNTNTAITSESFRQFIGASQNFNQVLHDYWPLPNSEIIDNTTL